MAKKSGRRKGKRKGVGSTVRVRRVSGLGQLNQPTSTMGSTVPVVIGGGVAALATIGISQWLQPTAENEPFRRNAPWIGMGAGIVAGLGLGAMTRKQPTSNMAIASAVMTALAFLLPGWMAQMGGGAMPVAAGAGQAGLRAVVPEYSMAGARGRRGTGAIVMEPQASRGYGAGPLGRLASYGETVSLGRVNTSAFGTPGFALNGGRG